MKKKIAIIAGEASGDLQGALLARHLYGLEPELSIFGVGGPRMKKERVRLLYDSSEWGAVGFREGLLRVPGLWMKIVRLKRTLLSERPDILVLIDSPAINMRLAKFARKHGLNRVYYFPPSAWSRDPGRARRIAAIVGNVIATFPITVSTYAEAGVKAAFFGHPIMDYIGDAGSVEDIRKKMELPEGKRLIGLLPGSRTQEVRALLPPLLGGAEIILKAIPEAHFVIPVATPALLPMIRSFISGSSLPVTVFDGTSHDVMRVSELLLTSSGTATLEAACLGIPMVVIYRLPRMDWFLAKIFVHVPCIALPNLILGRKVLPELLQDQATPANIAACALEILTDPRRKEAIKEELNRVRSSLGEAGVVEKVARHILELSANA